MRKGKNKYPLKMERLIKVTNMENMRYELYRESHEDVKFLASEIPEGKGAYIRVGCFIYEWGP